MTITKAQAHQILVLASNYGNYEAAAEVAFCASQYQAEKKFQEKSNNTWLKLKELVHGLTVPSDEVETLTEE